MNIAISCTPNLKHRRSAHLALGIWNHLSTTCSHQCAVHSVVHEPSKLELYVWALGSLKTGPTFMRPGWLKPFNWDFYCKPMFPFNKRAPAWSKSGMRHRSPWLTELSQCTVIIHSYFGNHILSGRNGIFRKWGWYYYYILHTLALRTARKAGRVMLFVNCKSRVRE